MAVDHDRAVAAVTELLAAVGEDPARGGLQRTPVRVAEMYAEILGGHDDDPAQHLDVTFEEDHDEMVMERDIPVQSLCEHHLLPFIGRAHVAYIPGEDGRITGLSKLARLVDGYSRRLQVQERLTTQIAETIQNAIEPQGVGVVVEARHLCMMMRGVEKQHSSAVTSSMLGCFRDCRETREEFLSLIRQRSNGV